MLGVDILERSTNPSEKSLSSRELQPLCGDVNAAYSSSNISAATAPQRAAELASMTSQQDLCVSRASLQSCSSGDSSASDAASVDDNGAAVGNEAVAMRDLDRDGAVALRDLDRHGVDRDSGCFTTAALDSNDLAGVRSLFSTLDRTALRHGRRSRVTSDGSDAYTSCLPTTSSKNTADMHSYKTPAVDTRDLDEYMYSDVLNEYIEPGSEAATTAVAAQAVPTLAADLTEVPCCQRSNEPHMHSKV